MDFILNNSGLLFGIGLVVVFAIIGYFADKKDNRNNANNVNMSNEPLKSDNVPSRVDDTNTLANDFGQFNDIVNELDNSGSSEQFKFDNNLFDINSSDLNNSLDNNNVNSESSYIEENSSSNETDILNNNDVQTNSVSSSVTDSLGTNINNYSSNSQPERHIDPFGANDFESLDISLEDLEKKNYSDVLNSKTVSDDENFYYSNMENSYSDNLGSSTNSVSNVNNFDFSTVENQNDVSVDVENHVDNSIAVDNQDDVSSDFNHLFDGETQSSFETNNNNYIDSKSDDESISVAADSSDQKYDNSDSIPELFGGASSYSNNNLNDSNGSSDDEIWKF